VSTLSVYLYFSILVTAFHLVEYYPKIEKKNASLGSEGNPIENHRQSAPSRASMFSSRLLYPASPKSIQPYGMVCRVSY
jgi:hypothetical protein